MVQPFRAGNLPSRISERDVEYEFKPFGRILSVWVARKPPGFGAPQTPAVSTTWSTFDVPVPLCLR